MATTAESRLGPTVVVLREVMAISISLGISYFAAVFTFAFLAGTARVLVVAPRLGTTAAVLLEVPVLIAVSWIVARFLLRRRSLTLPQRATMGAIAFALTIASEAALSWLMRGQSVTEWAGTLTTDLGLVGLAGQAIFGAMPILVGQGRASLPPSSA
jgi:hypothetical protein